MTHDHKYIEIIIFCEAEMILIYLKHRESGEISLPIASSSSFRLLGSKTHCYVNKMARNLD